MRRRKRHWPRWPRKPVRLKVQGGKINLASLGCAGFARIDLMLCDATGELTVLEANTVPGMTDTSLLPQAADAAGIGFDELIERVVQLALK